MLPNDEGIRDFRDPKVVWYAPGEVWVMVLAAGDHVKFYESDNLLQWRHLSDFGAGEGTADVGVEIGIWECPDFLPMRVAGADEERWVLLASINDGAPNGGTGTQYFVGDFDGTRFTLDAAFAADVADGQFVWLDYGRDNYAGVTWTNAPARDGRALFIGWMSNWQYAQVVPTERWRSATTVSRELTLRSTAEGYRLHSQPVKELTALRGSGVSLDSATQALEGGLADIELTFVLAAGATDPLGVELSNAAGERYRVGYDPATHEYFSDRSQAGAADFHEGFATQARAPREATSDTLRMRLLADWSSAELFADGGATVMTEVFFPSAPFDRVRLLGGASIHEARAFPLERIW